MTEALELAHDFGPITDAVLDVEMAAATQLLNERYFEFATIVVLQRRLLDLRFTQNPQWLPVSELHQAMAERWPHVITGGTSEGIHRQVQASFSAITPSRRFDTGEFEAAVKRSLIDLHPDRGVTKDSRTAATFANAQRPQENRTVQVKTNTDDSVESIDIDSVVSTKLNLLQNQADIIWSLAQEVNDPASTREALGKAYHWLDLTAGVPLDVTELAQRLEDEQRSEPGEQYGIGLTTLANAICLLVNDAGGYSIYSQYDQNAMLRLQDLLGSQVPQALEEMWAFLNTDSEVDFREMPSENHDLLMKQVERLGELVRVGGTLSLLDIALFQSESLFLKITEFNDWWKQRDVESMSSKDSISTLALSGLRMVLEARRTR